MPALVRGAGHSLKLERIDGFAVVESSVCKSMAAELTQT